MPVRKRSFRISEAQAEILTFCLRFFLIKTEEHEELYRAHRKSAEKMIEKLEQYEWEVETK